MKKIICLFASAFLLSAGAKAQLSCGTDALYNKLKKEDPTIKEAELKLIEAIRDAIAKEKASGLLFGKTTATTYDVPIVVHVIHDYGAEYLSDDAIFEAVAYWDKVFNAENLDTADVITPFKKYVGNPQIHLRLATIDPSGKPTKGITRRQSLLTYQGGDNAKMDYWPSNQYINVWFVNKFSAAHSGAAAYAYYPVSGARFTQYDGIIGVYSYLNYDKAIPHEFGHVLNLAHTWGDTNDPGVGCGDDGVDDTPPTQGHTNCLPAALYDVTCSMGYTKGGIDYPDTNNTQNIMDYAYCQKMFTIGQADRMRAALTNSVAGRNNLITAANLAATGALLPRPDLLPTADFSVERGIFGWGGVASEKTFFLCQGSTTRFSFRNRSWNDTVTNVNWTFTNSPATPNSTLLDAAVLNTFADPGWATITLAATGNNSGTSTISRQAVYVASNTAYSSGYSQYFNTPADFGNWPMFNYTNNNFKWEYSATNGYPNTAGSIRYRSFDDRTVPEIYSGDPDGDYDDIFTPAFDLTSFDATANVNLNFYTSGSATSRTVRGDSLQIFASTTCGDSWVRISALQYGDIINNPTQNTEFAPTNASQWKGQTINVPVAQRTNKTFFRFRYWPSKGGNNFYMDNFTLSPWTTDIKEVAQNATEVKLFPNPTSGNSKLCFTAGSNGEATYIIRDVTGKIIVQKVVHAQPNTFVQEELTRAQFPGTGIYLITLIQSEHTVTQKLVVE